MLYTIHVHRWPKSIAVNGERMQLLSIIKKEDLLYNIKESWNWKMSSSSVFFLPGEVIGDEQGLLRGHGTFIEGHSGNGGMAHINDITSNDVYFFALKQTLR